MAGEDDQDGGAPPPPPPPENRPNFGRIEFPKLTDAQGVEYWFIRVESWFSLQGIEDETVRFKAIVASLTPQLFDQVVDLVVTPPDHEPYKKLKAAIIEKFADSEFTRVDKMLSTVPLGAQRPSHLLAEIRRAGATRDERILRVVWLRRLPVSIRICRYSYFQHLEHRSVNWPKWPTHHTTRFRAKIFLKSHQIWHQVHLPSAIRHRQQWSLHKASSPNVSRR